MTKRESLLIFINIIVLHAALGFHLYQTRQMNEVRLAQLEEAYKVRAGLIESQKEIFSLIKSVHNIK